MKDIDEVKKAFDALLKQSTGSINRIMKMADKMPEDEKAIFLKATGGMANALTRRSEAGLMDAATKAMNELNNLQNGNNSNKS